ncbi:hypothetical protein [Macrococcus animalis]|uniref:hypothetical protein n=1 Tax=Macrococcus animalis TaxID=3395467 RepID=UPI0039BE9EBB
MNLINLSGIALGLGIIIFPISALTFFLIEIGKKQEEKSFNTPIFFIVLFIICGILLAFMANKYY